MKKALLVVIFCAVLLSGISGYAYEGYLHISPYQFYEGDGTTYTSVVGGATGPESYVYRNSSAGYAFAAFQFPPEADNMLVRQITITYKDNDSDDNIQFFLRKVDLYDQSVTTVASTTSASMDSRWRRMYVNRWDMAARRIDSQRYSWYVAVEFESNGSSLQLGSIKIKWASD